MGQLIRDIGIKPASDYSAACAAGCQSSVRGRLLDDAVEPARIAGNSSSAKSHSARHAIALERDVGDSCSDQRQRIVRREMLFHHAERLIALLHPVLERVRL